MSWYENFFENVRRVCERLVVCFSFVLLSEKVWYY